MTQVFQNLLDNAFKYGEDNTVVRVTARRLAKSGAGERRLGRAGLKVSVSNEGEGIEREHIPRLAERFYRIESRRSRRLGGTGLGLALVKHIVNRHRSEEHTSELQSLMRISYAVFCFKQKKTNE